MWHNVFRCNFVETTALRWSSPVICFGRTVVAVGRSHAVPLPEDYAEQRLEFIDRVSPDMTSWMHHDLERGHRLEMPWRRAVWSSSAGR
jgi:ketopantoate reductase